MISKCLLLIVLVISPLMSCSNQENSANGRIHSTQEMQKPKNSAKKITLPFTFTRMECNLKMTGGANIKINTYGDTIFDPPVRPEGDCTGIVIENKQVPLKSSVVKNGILQTSDFGDLEILIEGVRGRTEVQKRVMATQQQAEQIMEWLTKPERVRE